MQRCQGAKIESYIVNKSKQLQTYQTFQGRFRFCYRYIPGLPWVHSLGQGMLGWKRGTQVDYIYIPCEIHGEKHNFSGDAPEMFIPNEQLCKKDVCFCTVIYNCYNLQVPATEANYTTNNLYKIMQALPTCTLLSFRLCIYQFRHFGTLTPFKRWLMGSGPPNCLGMAGKKTWRNHGEPLNLQNVHALNSTRWNKMDVCALNSAFQDVLEVHFFLKSSEITTS